MFDNPLLALMNLALSYNDTSGPLPPSWAVGTDPFLTDIAVQDLNADQDFITPTVFPIVPVQNPLGTFKVWDRGSLLRPEFRLHAYGDRPVQGSYKTNTGTFQTEHWSLERPLAPSDRASAKDPLQPEKDAVYYLTQQARLNIDLRWTTSNFKTGIWAFEYHGVAANPNQGAATPEFLQFDQAGVNPAQFIRGRSERMRRMTGMKPNVLVLGVDVYAALVFNEDITDRVKYVQQGVADIDLLASFFDVGKVVVAGGINNAAAEGLPADFQYNVDPKAMLLAYAAARPSNEIPSAGYTFNWERLYEAFEGDQERILNELALIRRGYADRTGVRWIQGHTATGIQVVAPDLGMFFSNVVGTSQSSW